MESFVELVQYQFDNHPDNLAILYRKERITFSQLAERAGSVGAFLQGRGLEVGDRVILYTPDKLSFLIIHLGIILSGGVSLPLNFSFTRDEMLYFLNDSGARFVFASGEQADVIREIEPDCPALEEILDPAGTLAHDHGAKFREVDVKPDDNCFILYSSGTTGTPKGVVHSHRNLAASLLSLKKCWRFTERDVLLNVLPLFHIHGLSFATHLSLVSGSAMLLEDRFHPLESLDKIADATVFMAVPTIYYALLRRPEFKQKAKQWKQTRLFTCGSAPIRPEVLPELESILGAPLINRYGMTESHVITSLPLGGPFPQGSVGLPLEGVDLKLVTEEGRTIEAGTDKADDCGVVGEVKMRSENLFSSYWNKPEATAGAFDQDGFFSTGDLGRFDEQGCLTLVGRKKDLIITGGYNVYPPVVERVINSFAQVKESAVIGVPDPRRGEQVVAVVVPEGHPDIDALRKHCREKLVNYQTPTRFELVDELPRNTMGKILKRELRDRIMKQDSAIGDRPENGGN